MFGECDPSGIEFFPSFAKRMDAASLKLFKQCGAPRRFCLATGALEMRRPRDRLSLFKGD